MVSWETPYCRASKRRLFALYCSVSRDQMGGCNLRLGRGGIARESGAKTGKMSTIK